MIKEAIKSYKSDNRGSAIITGLVVSAVLMVLCLSLLLVSYSLFLSTSNTVSDMPNKEMLVSAAEMVEDEIVSHNVEIHDGVFTIISDQSEEEIEVDIPELWKLIYEGIVNETWPYYDPNVSGHTEEETSKYFRITAIGSVKIIVQLYWEHPKGDSWDTNAPDGALLNAIYRLYDNEGKVLVKIEKKYKLSGIKNTVQISDQIVPKENVIIENQIVDKKTNWKITIKNTTDEDIENWYITFIKKGGDYEVLPSEIVTSEKGNGSLHIIKNKPGKGVISSGEELTVTIRVKGNGNANINTEDVTVYIGEFSNGGEGTGNSSEISYTTWKWNRIGD